MKRSSTTHYRQPSRGLFDFISRGLNPERYKARHKIPRINSNRSGYPWSEGFWGEDKSLDHSVGSLTAQISATGIILLCFKIYLVRQIGIGRPVPVATRCR
jgi:hypothetical protein